MIHDPYREYAPPGSLAPYVECFWTRAAGAGPAVEHRILPDGALDFVFALDDRRFGAMAVGTMTRALVIPPAAPRAFLGVRFHPGKAAAFLALPAAELTNLSVPLGELWRDGAMVHEAILAAATLHDRVGALARALERSVDRERADAPAVNAAVGALVASGGRHQVSALGPSLGITRQHLTRLFARHVGVSPKMFARVMRLRGVLRRIERDPRPDWAAIALESGYYDQSHLIGEFHELTGLTPSHWSSRDEADETGSEQLNGVRAVETGSEQSIAIRAVRGSNSPRLGGVAAVDSLSQPKLES